MILKKKKKNRRLFKEVCQRLPEVETWEEVEETRGEDGNYEADTEGDGEPPQALDSGELELEGLLASCIHF